MANPSEAFIAGMLCASLEGAQGFEIIEATLPDDQPPTIVLRGRKTGTEVVVTVQQRENGEG